ncbi:hypothetical protein HanPI659440_Chr03g0122841 [Helianthus annuus]|nr:hypothetical protein HanPI659440_Chr03g0122841 [Helianthus annuus]
MVFTSCSYLFLSLRCLRESICRSTNYCSDTAKTCLFFVFSIETDWSDRRIHPHFHRVLV